ncbi:structural maintenance of chromosomes protein 5 isoform X1 [Arachis duranensis]|uniref:Structural maintenance of chromosomes protein 5 n=2 Tax=Arachis duranensis TaxID=130453 RepID=A0A6P4C2R7_ARADU|nr:structural maintenance of chromosomes protein 5 isoform X1 [Arachis duranensis]
MADPPPPKRHKIVRGDDDYMPGNILEIELSKFMTFDHVKCKPGPRLNLVVGPNGSGKSSLVCAIALGLCGEPQLLGRATSVGAYVKRGEEFGSIKITLRGNNKDECIAITRKINTNNKSEWLLNGNIVPKSNVAETVKRFNIQVSNLTQFLPQDRVCEFAKLTPVQLLEETEKAVGDPQLPEQHRALVHKSYALRNIEVSMEGHLGTLNLLKKQNAELEKDVERVRLRDEILAKAETMKKKLPWLEYDMKKAQYWEAKQHENNAAKAMEESAKLLNDLKDPINKQKEEQTALDAKWKKVDSRIKENYKKRTELLDKESQLDVEMQRNYKDMEDLRRQEETRQKKIEKIREELAASELELENLGPSEPRQQEELQRLRAKASDIDYEAKQVMKPRISLLEREISHKVTSLNECKKRLSEMNNKITKCLHVLQEAGTDKIFEAFKWVQEHRKIFNKGVYGPVLLEVNVSNQDHAAYLEGQAAQYIWKSFITQDPRDRDLLVQHLKFFDVPVLNYTGEVDQQRETFRITEDMHALGIHSRLDQVFDAPSAVKEVLIRQFNLDHSYIGSRDTDKRADEVPKLGIINLWTPENHYRWSKSRYGGHISAMVEQVGDPKFIVNSSNAGEIEKLESQEKDLEGIIATLEEDAKRSRDKQKALINEYADLRRKMEEINKLFQLEKQKREGIHNRIGKKRAALKSLEESIDRDTEMAKLVDQANKLHILRFRNAMKLKELLVECVAYRRSFIEQRMSSIQFDAKIRKLEADLKQHERSAVEATIQFQNLKKETEACEQQLTDSLNLAESIAPLTPELQNKFREMPTTIEDLNNAIQETISEARAIFTLNNNALEEYEYRRQKIEELAEKIAAEKEEYGRSSTEIKEIEDKWLPALRNLVALINETFSRNFQEMAVAGEVSLDEHDKEYAQYGICIKVKFRQNGKLEVLSAHHQSGGERSVSTIVYLLSLQDLTNVPFRVVDEINQGMDPINERKMFQQLVRAASKPNTPQCFLLTPKLLPDLQYSEACTILNVFNGPWIPQPSKLWEEGERWSIVTGLLGETHC